VLLCRYVYLYRTSRTSSPQIRHSLKHAWTFHSNSLIIYQIRSNHVRYSFYENDGTCQSIMTNATILLLSYFLQTVRIMTDILKPKLMLLASCELYTSYCNIYLFLHALQLMLCFKKKKNTLNKIPIQKSINK